jgi:RHS repeat-associated protein
MGFESAYKYTGKELDNETNLMYYIARYYEPCIGSFLSVDPFYRNPDALEEKKFKRFLEHPILSNYYAFVLDNPLRFVDSYGLDPKPSEGAMYDLKRQMVCQQCYRENVLKLSEAVGFVAIFKKEYFPCLTDTAKGRKFSELMKRGILEHEKSHIRDSKIHGSSNRTWLESRILAYLPFTSRFTVAKLETKTLNFSEAKAYREELKVYRSEAKRRNLTETERERMEHIEEQGKLFEALFNSEHMSKLR